MDKSKWAVWIGWLAFDEDEKREFTVFKTTNGFQSLGVFSGNMKDCRAVVAGFKKAGFRVLKFNTNH